MSAAPQAKPEPAAAQARSRIASLSLKTRLRAFTIVLMISVVGALLALHLQSITWAKFDDLRERADLNAQQLLSFVVNRLDELIAERHIQAANLDELKRVWADLIAHDESISTFMQNTLAIAPAVTEVLIYDENGRILACTNPERVGKQVGQQPNFGDWVKRSQWGKLAEIFSQRRDYQVTQSLGVSTGPPIFTVKILLNSVLLRSLIFPQLRDALLIFLAALLLSMLLAVVVSNLALRPLHSISQAIDQISRGEAAAPASAPDSTLREFAAVQSKLQLLGQQYHGARHDAIQLRSNIEQLLERLEEVVFLFDREDHLVMAGRAAERIIGRSRWEIMGRSLTELFPGSTPLGAAVRNAIDLHQPVKDMLLTVDHGGGEADTRVLLNIEPLESFPEHERIGTLITFRDAETRRQIQSQLDVSARLAAISRLTGGVAHEIKNPLQAITVHLEVLKAKLADQQDEVGPAIETISREIQRLDRVVKAFLDFARPIDLRVRELETVALAGEVVKLVEPSAARQSVSVVLHADPGEIWIRGDRDLIQQAILNVVVNGVEAMKQGGRLEIRAERLAEDCQISISDQGPGVPPEIQDKIFNLYFSTKGKQGSGIGLAMTFRVVQLHNGTVDFTTEAGKGTTFRLRFPAVIREPAPVSGNSALADR